MTLKNPFKPLTPHGERRLFIHFIIILLIGIAIFCASSCETTRQGKDPCKYRRGMSGYGYGWLKCVETGKVCILYPDGSIVCTYIDKK